MTGTSTQPAAGPELAELAQHAADLPALAAFTARYASSAATSLLGAWLHAPEDVKAECRADAARVIRDGHAGLQAEAADYREALELIATGADPGSGTARTDLGRIAARVLIRHGHHAPGHDELAANLAAGRRTS